MLYIILSVLVAILVLPWALHKIKSRRMIELAKKIPGPNYCPVTGNIRKFSSSTDVIVNVLRFSKEYNKDFRVWLGPQLCVFVQEPNHVQHILRGSKYLDKASYYQLNSRWLSGGLIMSKGEKHANRRKLIESSVNGDIVETFLNAFNFNVNVLLQKLRPHVDGQELDVCHWMSLLVMDCMTETCLGKKHGALEAGKSSYVTAVQNMLEATSYRLFRPWLYPEVLFRLTSAGKRHSKGCDVVQNLAYDAIRSKKEEIYRTAFMWGNTIEDTDGIGVPPFPFLDTLVRASKNGAILTDDDLREEIDSLFFAGYDPTATALSFCLWALATKKDVQENLMKEIQDRFGNTDRTATYEDLQGMKYMDKVVMETLRLYTPVPVFGRDAKEDVNLGDYVIPAGANIIIAPFAMHRNPELYPEPLRFDPERFSPENIAKRHPYSYIPFSTGPRKCAASNYASLMIKATLCGLLRKYKILPGSTEPDLYYKLTLGSTNGLRIKLKERHQ